MTISFHWGYQEAEYFCNFLFSWEQIQCGVCALWSIFLQLWMHRVSHKSGVTSSKQGFNCLFDKAAFELKSAYLQLIWSPLVLRICWVGKTRMNYRVAAHIPQLLFWEMDMNAQLWRGFDERKTTRGFWKGRRRSWKEMQARTSECVGMQSCGFPTLFGTKKSLLCLSKTIPTSHVTYTIRKKRGKKYSNHLAKVILTYLCFYYLSYMPSLSLYILFKRFFFFTQN